MGDDTLTNPFYKIIILSSYQIIGVKTRIISFTTKISVVVGGSQLGVGFNGCLRYVVPVATQVKNQTKLVQSIFFLVKNLNKI